MTQSTYLTWFWAIMFGPIYFAVHGFWARALILLVASMALFLVLNVFALAITIPLTVIMAYSGWRNRSRKYPLDDLPLAR
jgi:hypothetical protein